MTGTYNSLRLNRCWIILLFEGLLRVDDFFLQIHSNVAFVLCQLALELAVVVRVDHLAGKNPFRVVLGNDGSDPLDKLVERLSMLVEQLGCDESGSLLPGLEADKVKGELGVSVFHGRDVLSTATESFERQVDQVREGMQATTVVVTLRIDSNFDHFGFHLGDTLHLLDDVLDWLVDVVANRLLSSLFQRVVDTDHVCWEVNQDREEVARGLYHGNRTRNLALVLLALLLSLLETKQHDLQL